MSGADITATTTMPTAIRGNHALVVTIPTALMGGSPLVLVPVNQLIGGEVEVARRFLVQVGRRVVDQHQRDVRAAVDVGQHGGDPGDLVGEEQVLGVGPARRVHPHQAAARRRSRRR